MEKFQSAYKAHHSTETALLRDYNDVMFNIDRCNGTLVCVQMEAVISEFAQLACGVPQGLVL